MSEELTGGLWVGAPGLVVTQMEYLGFPGPRHQAGSLPWTSRGPETGSWLWVLGRVFPAPVSASPVWSCASRPWLL